MQSNPQIKIIGANGQLSIGKEFAGKMVIVEQVEEGTWLIKTGKFIPDSEKRLYESDNFSKIERGIKRAKNNKSKD